MCGCTDVDLRHAHLSRTGGDYLFKATGTTKLARTRFAKGAIFWRSASAKCPSKLGGYLAMATEPVLALLDAAAVPRRPVFPRSGVLSAYWSLTKPEVNFLIAVTTAAGFWMGAPASFAHFPWASLL